MKKKKNKKEYGHIAVSPELKRRFEEIRFKMMGKELRDVTHEDLLILLLNKYQENE